MSDRSVVTTKSRYLSVALAMASIVLLAINTYMLASGLRDLFLSSQQIESSVAGREFYANLTNKLLSAEVNLDKFKQAHDRQFLALYEREMSSIEQRLELSGDFAAEKRTPRLQRLRDLIGSRLSQLKSAAASSNPPVSKPEQNAAGNLLTEIQELAAELGKVEQATFERSEAHFERAKNQSTGALFAFAFGTALLIAVAVLLPREELKKRTLISLQLEKQAAELDRVASSLRAERNEVAYLNEINNLLQNCDTFEEVGTTLLQVMPSLFGNYRGRVYIYAPSRNELDVLASWSMSADDHPILPSSCWALRIGQPYLRTTNRELPCCHHLDGIVSSRTICVPLVAHGDTIGLLTLSASEQGDPSDDVNSKRLAEMAGRQMGLTIANIRLRQTLNDQSIKDPLTGAFNRRYLDIVAEKELSRAARSNQPLSVAMIDIDHFKQFNDLHGHLAGDHILIAMSKFLRERIRDSDWLFRFGGEEFLLILPETDASDAASRMTDIKNEISAMSINFGGLTLPAVTFSGGVSQLAHNGRNLGRLIEAADHALYQSKSTGRNRVTISDAAA